MTPNVCMLSFSPDFRTMGSELSYRNKRRKSYFFLNENMMTWGGGGK